GPAKLSTPDSVPNSGATTASPAAATDSQTRSPTTKPAMKGATPFRPWPRTRATSAAMPGPGVATATKYTPAKISKAENDTTSPSQKPAPGHPALGAAEIGAVKPQLSTDA